MERFDDHTLLSRRFRIPQNAAVLHAGCGNGNVLRELRDKFSCATYGIDPEVELAQKAKDHADAVIRGEPGTNTIVASEAFSLVILPTVAGEMDIRYSLQWAWKRLVPGGIVLVSIHTDDLEPFAKAALPRFEMLKGGRYGKNAHLAALQRRDAYQPTFKQDVETASLVLAQDTFYYHSSITIPVPPAPSRAITPFRGLLSLEEVANLIDHSTLMDDALSSLALSHTAREEVPPLPLKQGHIALQLACGQFNGAVGTGDHRHVVKGRVVRTPFSREEIDDNGNTVTITEETLAVEITAIDQSGVCRRFTSKGED